MKRLTFPHSSSRRLTMIKDIECPHPLEFVKFIGEHYGTWAWCELCGSLGNHELQREERTSHNQFIWVEPINSRPIDEWDQSIKDERKRLKEKENSDGN